MPIIALQYMDNFFVCCNYSGILYLTTNQNYVGKTSKMKYYSSEITMHCNDFAMSDSVTFSGCIYFYILFRIMQTTSYYFVLKAINESTNEVILNS